MLNLYYDLSASSACKLLNLFFIVDYLVELMSSTVTSLYIREKFHNVSAVWKDIQERYCEEQIASKTSISLSDSESVSSDESLHSSDWTI